ncbi:EamA-like transporter family protein [Lachnoanaerobaculum saburreum F0468]|uniref:EamA-like transporter family protein n=1 Tax=Lachnoanaerobaculum saburreum F0468 TaxID=1095750 RepID=I0R8V8_9FIRM|nr:DMT family transporter [Lachnoanaerobaculum saburreum]EIC96116.1 EamA-like transporter family protein [Lachnoanaerobaculum saburreum F0468]
MKKTLGITGLVIVTIIWGGGFVASDIALNELSPFEIMGYRFLIASIIMGVFAWRNLKTIRKDEIIYGSILGIVLFSGFSLQIIGLKYTTPSNNAFLTATNVVMVPFIAYFIGRKKLNKADIIGSFTALIGVGVLSLQNNFSIGSGDLFTLFCALGFAFQIYLTGIFGKKIRPSILNFLQMFTAFCLSIIGLLFSGSINLSLSKQGFSAIIYLGVVSTALCYFLQTAAQKHVDETKSAIILSMEAVFGTLFSIVLLGEKPNLKMVIGGIMILSAVLISELQFFKEKQE